jgi:hypothetical protein
LLTLFKGSTTRDDHDYRPSKDESEDEESDASDGSDEESDASGAFDPELMAEEDDEPELDYIEVKMIGGKYVKLKVAKSSQDTDNEVLSKVKSDDRFKANSRRGGARLAMVIVRAVSLLHRIDGVDFDILILLSL